MAEIMGLIFVKGAFGDNFLFKWKYPIFFMVACLIEEVPCYRLNKADSKA